MSGVPPKTSAGAGQLFRWDNQPAPFVIPATTKAPRSRLLARSSHGQRAQLDQIQENASQKTVEVFNQNDSQSGQTEQNHDL